jgi:hypothetical protein
MSEDERFMFPEVEPLISRWFTLIFLISTPTFRSSCPQFWTNGFPKCQ